MFGGSEPEASPTRTGSEVDVLDTMPMEFAEGETHADSKPQRPGEIPSRICDPPQQMIGSVLRTLWADPPQISDPSLQHKKAFRRLCREGLLDMCTTCVYKSISCSVI